jgi:hypothetical protein
MLAVFSANSEENAAFIPELATRAAFSTRSGILNPAPLLDRRAGAPA